ncbi:MAG: Gfo/Idh/MocA family oxidoreductase [Planctomycetaceae bacterium]|jgi:predicted dehydrogenase|nr:Gfo/Idh/MocA family oxidoreductase [Planctomycetaceae bacterium]
MKEKSSRRNFLKASVILGAVAPGRLAAQPRREQVHIAENSQLKVGLVGCGSRGRGAAMQALKADPNAVLVAIGDAFREQAQGALKVFQMDEKASQVLVTEDTLFDGLECYKKVIEASDVVLLCEPPHFRPLSLKAAVEAGKHVFCEKPVAVDIPGIKSVLESAKKAKEKGLNLVSGLCWRYHPNVVDIMNRVREGQIGKIINIDETYLTGRLWTRGRKDGDSEIKFQVRNWYNFTWLSGDFNAEQHIHSLDKAVWANDDEAPVSAVGVGGRMVRVAQPAYGDIYDSFGIKYEFANGVTCHAYCRQIDKCYNNTDDYIYGTGGKATVLAGVIEGENPYKVKGGGHDMYALEHVALFDAIRSGGGQYINNGIYMANSTLMAVMGRIAAYTGQRVTYEKIMTDETSLSPDGYTWESTPPTVPDEKGRYKVALPGIGYGYYGEQH